MESNCQNFCSECGLSLKRLDTACTSRNCERCSKEVFYVRYSDNGGIKVEAGEKFHIPEIKMSLDPKDNGRFFKPGLESFLKNIFYEKSFKCEDIVDRFKTIEKSIDQEISNLDCVQHCDLNTEKGTQEAAEILKYEGMNTYLYNLIRSIYLRHSYESIEKGLAKESAYYAHLANVFKEYSLLEDEHLKEIIWLGYCCYTNIERNSGSTKEMEKEKFLIKGVEKKINGLSINYIYALVNDGQKIGTRLGVTGVSEETLKALLQFELDERGKVEENSFREREIKIKKAGNNIKVYGVFFTLANGLILALYKWWLG